MFHNLDFLRACAVMAVLASHLIEYLFPSLPDTYAQRLGRLGVITFFVHTALVLMYSMRRSERVHHGWDFLRDFYVRRAFRIYPLAVLIILLTVFLQIPDTPLHSFTRPSAGALCANLSLVQNLTGARDITAPLWTLPLEVQMYVFLPFLFLWRPRWFIWVAVWVVAVLVVWKLPGHGAISGLRFVPCFLGGVIAFSIGSRPLISSRWWPAHVIACMAFFMVQGNMWIYCLLLGLSIPFFSQIQSRPLTFSCLHVARYSYGVYLLHQGLIWVCFFRLGVPVVWQGFIFIVSLACASMVSYYLVEAPLIGVGIRLGKRNEQVVGRSQGLDSPAPVHDVW